MESPGRVGNDTVVAIAINKGRVSQATLKWAVDHLVTEGQSLTLVHVRPKAEAFDNNLFVDAETLSIVHENVGNGYKELLETRARELLLPFQSFCKAKNIQSDLVIIEDGDVGRGLEEFVLRNHIDVLVLGAGSRGGIIKKLKGPGLATRVTKKIPQFCTVYTVAKGKLQSVRAASTAQILSLEGAQFREHEECSSKHSINVPPAYDRSSVAVTDRTSILPPVPAKEFVFRSPLKDGHYSNFTVGGSESDITFVGSDRESYDSSADSLSKYSDFSRGSIAPSYVSSSTYNSEWSMGYFGSSIASDYLSGSKDELQRLHMDLMKTKKMYESTCDETHKAKNLMSELKMLNPEDDHGMNRVQGSTTVVAQSSIGNNEQAMKNNYIAKRIAELEEEKKALTDMMILGDNESIRDAISS